MLKSTAKPPEPKLVIEDEGEVAVDVEVNGVAPCAEVLGMRSG